MLCSFVLNLSMKHLFFSFFSFKEFLSKLNEMMGHTYPSLFLHLMYLITENLTHYIRNHNKKNVKKNNKQSKLVAFCIALLTFQKCDSKWDNHFYIFFFIILV